MADYDFERDLRILQAMAGELARYLREDELLWPLPGRVPGGMPRLTAGGMLLRRHRLAQLGHHLDPAGQAALPDVFAALDATLAEWPVHYQQKIAQEWPMRVNLLRDYLRDCEDAAKDGETARRSCRDYWPSRAEQRTILYHLRAAAASQGALSSEMQQQIKQIDRGLRQFLAIDDMSTFLWQPELADAYPREPFWWLWVTLRSDDTGFPDSA